MRAPAVLTEEEFKTVGDQVFKAEVQKLTSSLLSKRQMRGKNYVGDYPNCVLERRSSPAEGREIEENRLLDDLGEGEAVFNFITNFGKGSFNLNDARVTNVELAQLVLNSPDPNLSLTVQIEHSGESIIGTNAENGERVLYFFQSGRNAAPINWRFVYTHTPEKPAGSEQPASRIARCATEDTVGATIKQLNPDIGELKEYSPSLFSNYRMRFLDLRDGRGQKKDIRVQKLVLKVSISTGGDQR